MSLPAAFPDYLRTLFALWDTKRGLRIMPSRRDFATVELQPWLNELHLVAVRPEGLRFVVFASGPATRYGTEMTGRTVGDLQPAAMADEVERAFDLNEQFKHVGQIFGRVFQHAEVGA